MVSPTNGSRSKESKRITRSFAAIIILTFVICLGFGAVYVINDNRKDDIRQARIEACTVSLDGIHQVFLPLFTDPPRTARRIHRTKVFNDGITKLKQKCLEQPKR